MREKEREKERERERERETKKWGVRSWIGVGGVYRQKG